MLYGYIVTWLKNNTEIEDLNYILFLLICQIILKYYGNGREVNLGAHSSDATDSAVANIGGFADIIKDKIKFYYNARASHMSQH